MSVVKAVGYGLDAIVVSDNEIKGGAYDLVVSIL